MENKSQRKGKVKKLMQFITISVILACLFATLSVNVFADYVSVQGVDNIYDIDSSVGLDMLYSNGAWGGSTYGYISLDATPVPGQVSYFCTDRITMMRQDTEELKSFDINSGYIRHVSTGYNGMVVDHGLGGGTLTSSQLSKITLISSNPIVYDTDRSSTGMPLYYVKCGYPGSMNLYPSITFNYISSSGAYASYTMRPDPISIPADGVQYIYYDLYNDEMTSVLRDKALLSDGLALISDYTVTFDYDRNTAPITDGTLGIYQYYPKNGYDYINNGDITIISVERYALELAQRSYNQGVVAGQSVDFLGGIYNAVNGFLNAPLFGTFSLGDILSTMICVMVIVAFLKAFAGG